VSFTFNPELGDNLDKIRVLLGDTVETGHKAEDETILWAIEVEENVFEAAALVADILSAKYSSTAQSRTIGELSLQASNLARQFGELASSLRTQRSRRGVPIAFGWSKADKEVAQEDEDREPIISRKGGMDYPGTDEGI